MRVVATWTSPWLHTETSIAPRLECPSLSHLSPVYKKECSHRRRGPAGSWAHPLKRHIRSRWSAGSRRSLGARCLAALDRIRVGMIMRGAGSR